MSTLVPNPDLENFKAQMSFSKGSNRLQTDAGLAELEFETECSYATIGKDSARVRMPSLLSVSSKIILSKSQVEIL